MIQRVTYFTKKRNDVTMGIKFGASFITLKISVIIHLSYKTFCYKYFLICYGVKVIKKYSATIRSSKKSGLTAQNYQYQKFNSK